jgi:hypothetical protein
MRSKGCEVLRCHHHTCYADIRHLTATELTSTVHLREPTLECEQPGATQRLKHFVTFYNLQISWASGAADPQAPVEETLSPNTITELDEILERCIKKSKILLFWIHAGYSVAYRIYKSRSAPKLPEHLKPMQFLIGRRAGTAQQTLTYICAHTLCMRSRCSRMPPAGQREANSIMGATEIRGRRSVTKAAPQS